MGLGYLIFFLISFFMWQNLKKGTELFQSFCFSSVVSVLLLALHVSQIKRSQPSHYVGDHCLISHSLFTFTCSFILRCICQTTFYYL